MNRKIKEAQLENKSVEINQELVLFIDSFIKTYNFSFLKNKSGNQLESIENDEERLLVEIPSVALFLNTVYNILNFQIKNKEKISDEVILNILPTLISKVPIPKENYETVVLILRHLFSERKMIRHLIRDDISIKKRMLNSKKHPYSPEEVHNIASRIKIEESIFGVLAYVDSRILPKLYPNGNNVEGLHVYKFFYTTNPTKYKRNKSEKFRRIFPLILIATGIHSETNELVKDKLTVSIRLHEEFHRMYYLIEEIKKIKKEGDTEKEELKEETSKKWHEFYEDKTEISGSQRRKKFREYLQSEFELNNFRLIAYKNFLNELCAQIEGGNIEIKLRGIKHEKAIRNFIFFFLNAASSYFEGLFREVNNFLPDKNKFAELQNINTNDSNYNMLSNPQALIELFNKELNKATYIFKDNLRDEFEEIGEIVYRIYNKSKLTRLILFTILTTENPLDVKKRLLLLEKSIDLYYTPENEEN